MTNEDKIGAFLKEGRQAMLDFIIDNNPIMSAQSVNMQSLVMTDLELATWCLSISDKIKEMIATEA